MSSIWQEVTHSLGSFYLSLALLSLIVAWIAAMILKRRFSDGYARLVFFFWAFNIAAPLLGVLATFWIVYYLMTVQYEEALTETSSIDMSEVYSEFPEVQRIFGEASIRQILSSNKAPDDLKMKALVSLAENIRKNEIALIKQTLSDRNDEIRLYSFAIIDKLERTINNTIHTKLDNYRQSKNTKDRAKLAGEIAQLYWEMLYFELADEDLRHFITLEIDHYATEALKEYPESIALNTLMGRCCLMTREYERAEKYFEKLISQYGVGDNSITPYLAELYYIKHDYQHVKQLMHDTDNLRSNQLLNPVIEIWNEKESA